MKSKKSIKKRKIEKGINFFKFIVQKLYFLLISEVFTKFDINLIIKSIYFLIFIIYWVYYKLKF